MKALKDFPNSLVPNSTYPYGSILDESAPGARDGTPMNRQTFGDIYQLMAKVFNDYTLLTGNEDNGLPDNADNGFQLYTAFKKIFRPYLAYAAKLTQSGTDAPDAQIEGDADFNINWTYDSVGDYRGEIDIPGYNPAQLMILTGTPWSFPHGVVIRPFGLAPNDITISTTADVSSGTPANAILLNHSIEVRYYF